MDRFDPKGPILEALRAYVPPSYHATVLLPYTELSKWSLPLGRLGNLVAYGKPNTKIVFDEPTITFAVPPKLPRVDDWQAHADFAVLSEQYASLCTDLTRVVALDLAALETADPEVIAPLGQESRDRAERFIRWLSAVPRVFRQRDSCFALPSTGWEIEVGDLIRERMCQAPSGEVFVHLDTSDWTGRIGLPTGGWMDVKQGIVREVNRFPNAVGQRVCEIGFGLNPSVRDENRSWGEKALGTVHLGLGLTGHDDLLPPTIHFDVLIESARYLNHDLWSLF